MTAEQEAAAPARLSLVAASAASDVLDGAWWPRSRDLKSEIPALMDELGRRRHRFTRVDYHPDGWLPGPSRLTMSGRVVRLGWFRRMDPHLVTITEAGSVARVDLLVVPPDTEDAVASRAMATASLANNRTQASDVLRAASTTRVTDPSEGSVDN